MSDDVRRAEDGLVTEIAHANEAAERLAAYYLGGQPGIYYTEEDARAAFTGDILKVVKGYQSLREQLEQAKIRAKQLEDDDKPIDGLWLASLGPLKRGDYELQISVDGYCAWWLIDSNGIDRGMYLCHAHTRGQVRRLLEALGIDGE